MSVVTYVSEPQFYTPSDNPITWVVSYPISGTYNLSFETTVYYEGEIVAVLRKTPERSSGVNYYTHFDVSNIIKTYVNKANVDQTTISSDAKNYGTVGLETLVYYSTTATGIPVAYPSTNAGSDYINAFKSRISNKEFSIFDYADYLIGTAYRKFLTDNTNNVELRENDETFLQIITNNIDIRLVIELYDNANAYIDYVSITPTAAAITQFKFSTEILKDHFTPTQVNNTKYFAVYITNSTDDIRSEIKVININREGCYKGKNVTWLNKFGAYDTFLFTYNNILKSDVQSKTYGKQFGAWNGNTSYEYTTKDTGTLTYLKTITDKIQIVSDWLTQSVQNWLVSVYDSPLVYINEETTYENIEIENSSYAMKQSDHEELFNEIIDCKFTHTRNSVII
jgi:hypothetical protein